MPIVIADEVRAALGERRAVVALESTILAHGLPWPDNLEIGRGLEDAVRAAGAVPATIAVLGGRACVGLGAAELEQVARGGSAFAKAGAGDLAVHLARAADAATTVAGTVHLAAHAGIPIMATGGIGGVHRGAGWDVSNDLAELAARRVAVVSAGAKAILDLPRTAETLETLGVLLLGVRTSELPAFYTPWSGVPLEHRVETADEVAAVLEARWALGQGGVLVCNPIPPEAALDPTFVDGIIAAALTSADRAGVRGKALTPYLLGELERQSGGATVRANRALALSNARLAAEIAVALARRTVNGRM
jgi:pseudouridine-5'-phosphate glycosidase